MHVGTYDTTGQTYRQIVQYTKKLYVYINFRRRYEFSWQKVQKQTEEKTGLQTAFEKTGYKNIEVESPA